MITTRRTSGLAAAPQYRAGYGLGAGRMSYGAGYGDYGDVVNVRGLGEVIRWAPLGPGGDPQMSLQGRRGLFGIPTKMDEVDWYQLSVGALLGVGAYMLARKQKWIK